jgi:hypothetical protein
VEGRREAFERDGWVHLPALIDPTRCEAVQRDLAPHFDRTGAGRLLNAWEVSAAVRALAVEPAVAEVVTDLLNHEVLAFQTLDFRHGTEQDAHVDALFFDTLPRGRMCGAWVALEAAGPDAGPLRLWPGTHRTEPLWAADIGEREEVAEVCARRLGGLPEPVDVEVAQGDVVIWAADLLHGGAPVRDPAATRWSQVTHYVATDHIYLSPLTSDHEAGRYMVRDQLVDVATGRRVVPRLDGRRVVFAHGRGGLSRIVVEPSAAARLGLAAGDLRHGLPRARRRVAAVTRRAARRLAKRPTAS